jgi:hypothetical protein
MLTSARAGSAFHADRIETERDILLFAENRSQMAVSNLLSVVALRKRTGKIADILRPPSPHAKNMIDHGAST